MIMMMKFLILTKTPEFCRFLFVLSVAISFSWSRFPIVTSKHTTGLAKNKEKGMDIEKERIRVSDTE